MNTPQEDIKVNVVMRDETIWLTQRAMTELFGVQILAINKHIKNIFADGELQEEAVVRKFRTVQIEGNRKISKKAETEYKKYQVTTLSPVEKVYLESVKALEKKVKSYNKK